MLDMTEVQSQPHIVFEAKTETSSADKDALISRLDDLLEQYLHTLDRYQKTHEQLSKQLSSVSSIFLYHYFNILTLSQGYLSLAQANFQNRSTAHYGQDSYDERMQATRKLYVYALRSWLPGRC